MAYDEWLADRIRRHLGEKQIMVTEKKMMGGLCFMVQDKMCVGIVKDQLMARIGPDQYSSALKHPHCNEMNFTGKAMKGFVFVSPEGIDSEEELEYWLQLCLDYNPLAKASKRKNI